MTPAQDVYAEAIEKLGYPGSAAGIKFLKLLFTPEEGRLLLEFIQPATCREVAQRLNIDEKTLQQKLDDFTLRRKLLYHGKTQYLFYLGLHAFFNCMIYLKEEYLPAGFWPAYAEFHLEEMEYLANRPPPPDAKPTGVPMSRIMPARLALAASPKVDPEQVLWYEDMAQILAREELISLTKCGCRRENQRCDRPLWTCFHFGPFEATRDVDNEYCEVKKLSVAEAIAASDEAEKAGLLHMLGNFPGIPERIMCSCCNDCCTTLEPILSGGRLRQQYSPSRYLAVVDTEKCTGCQECVERCFFNAIQMRLTLNSKKKKAHILKENCMGCGSCILGCKQKAITFELVRPPEHIPTQPLRARAGLYPYGYGSGKPGDGLE
jgi:NAD-dependent dihydropyrimidine dehydrogenase PreA subunit